MVVPFTSWFALTSSCRMSGLAQLFRPIPLQDRICPRRSLIMSLIFMPLLGSDQPEWLDDYHLKEACRHQHRIITHSVAPPATRLQPSALVTLLDGRSATDFCAPFQRPFPFVLLAPKMVLSFILVQNRQGKTRLAKWYAPYTDEEKVKLKGEVSLLPHLRRRRFLFLHRSYISDMRGVVLTGPPPHRTS